MTIQTAMNFIVPLAVFIEIVIFALALRFYFRKLLEKTQRSDKWIQASLFIESLWHPFVFWFVFCWFFFRRQLTMLPIALDLKKLKKALFLDDT